MHRASLDAEMIGEAEPLRERVSDIELEMLLEAIFLRYHQDFRGYARASLKRRIPGPRWPPRCPAPD
jgi:hypothetical protein